MQKAQQLLGGACHTARFLTMARPKDDDGNDTGKIVYAVDPRSYLIIGNLGQLLSNDDKVACFELFRRNLRAPEILTFDELYQRARFIVENISNKVQAATRSTEEQTDRNDMDDDIL